MKTSHLHFKKFTQIKRIPEEMVIIYDKQRRRFRRFNRELVEKFNKRVEVEKRYEFLPEVSFNSLSRRERNNWYGVE